MRKQETLIYGLKPAAYIGLMNLLSACPGYLCVNEGKGKKDKRKRKKLESLNDGQIHKILVAADHFEEVHMSLDLAVKRVLQSGWTGFSPRKTIERYRKYSPSQKKAKIHYAGMESTLSRNNLRRAWIHDDAMRSGPPQGPEFCQSREEIIREISSVYAEIGLRLGVELDNPSSFSIPDPESPKKANLDPVKLGKKIHAQAGLPLRMSTELLYYLLGKARSRIVTVADLADLRYIDVRIPLHHPKDVRNDMIEKIVAEWIRRTESGTTSKKRDRSVGLRNSLHDLPDRIKDLRGRLSKGRRDYVKKKQNPHTTRGDESTKGSAAFVKSLFDVLKAEGFLNKNIDVQDFDDCIQQVSDTFLQEDRDRSLSDKDIRYDSNADFYSEK